MGQILYRLLFQTKSLATLIAILSPLLALLSSLTLTSQAATASPLTVAAAPTELAEIPEDQLKDGDDGDDDDFSRGDDDDDDDEEGEVRSGDDSSTTIRTRTTTRQRFDRFPIQMFLPSIGPMDLSIAWQASMLSKVFLVVSFCPMPTSRRLTTLPS